MMTLVTANIASGSRETIRRTPTLVITMRGDASQTIRKIGKVLRSAARRSFQRGTGLAICGSNCLPWKLHLENYLAPISPQQPPTPLANNRGPKMLCFTRLTSHAKDEKPVGISVRSKHLAVL